MHAPRCNRPTNLAHGLFVALVDNIDQVQNIDPKWRDLVRWSVDDTLSHNKAMLRDYVESLFNGYIIRAYDAYKPFALTDPRHPIF